MSLGRVGRGATADPAPLRSRSRVATPVAAVLLAALMWSLGCTAEPRAARDSTPPPTQPEPSSTSTTGAPPTVPTTVAGVWTHDELRAELVEMMRQDQLERTGEGLPPGTRLPPIRDFTRASRLAEIVDAVGWPTFDMVGTEGATAAWVVAQHADHDVALQARWLELMDEAARRGQADPLELAYLVDRVAVNQGVPQRYGTQVRCRGGRPTPATPIEDDTAVDERRRTVGLAPLASYYDELAMMCAQEDADGQGPAE